MILDQRDKRNLTEKIKDPFLRLASRNEGSLGKKACLRVFKESHLPTLRSMELQYKEIYDRLYKAGFIEFESLDGKTQFVKIPTGLGAFPMMDGLTSNSDWHSRAATGLLITRKEISEALKDEEKETFAKSQLLIEKARRVELLLTEWLKPFTMPEQLQFSLPQIGYFVNVIDFRKRRSWGMPKPPVQTQRRPRVVNVPSDELKGLVAEAAMLAQSPFMKENAE